MSSKFLLSSVATHRPNAIVLSCRFRAIIIPIFHQFANLVLFFTNHHFESVHGDEVRVFALRPPISVHIVLNHQFFRLRIGTQDEIAELIEPIREKGLIGLGNEEVVFVCTEPHVLCVGPAIELPLKWLSEVWVEEH